MGSKKRLTLGQLCSFYLSRYGEGKSHTARAKRLDIEAFRHFIESHLAKSIESITVAEFSPATVQAFVDQLLSSGSAIATTQRRLATIKHLGRILSEHFSGFKNPTKDIRPPRPAALKPKSLADDDISRLVNKISEIDFERASFRQVRNLTMVALFLETGLRADEIRLLRMSQLKEPFTWIEQVRTKGRQFRNVYLPDRMKILLQSYLQRRERELTVYFKSLKIKTAEKLPVFISFYNVSLENADSFLMGSKSVWRAVRESSATIGEPLHPHLLRHTFALSLLRESNDIRLVSQALGHSDVRITMRYTERRDEEVAQAAEKASRTRGRLVDGEKVE